MELRSEYLDDRAATIDTWLIAVPIALAFVTLVVIIAGLLGYRVFRDILDDARGYRDEARKLATDIQAYKIQAQEGMHDIQNRVETTPSYEAPLTEPQELESDASVASDNLAVVPLSVETDQQNEEDDPVRTADKWFAEGYQYGQSGDYVAAVSAYDKAIELNPQSANAYNNRGHAKWMLGDDENAILDCDIAIALCHGYVEPYNNRGNAKFRSGRSSEAILDYGAAIEINPAYAPSYNNRGSANYEMGNYIQALEDYNRAILIDPQYVDAYYNRANAYFRSADYGNAILDYDQAISANPKHAGAYYNRGWALSALGRPIEALTSFATAMELALRQDNSELTTQIRKSIAVIGNTG